MRKARAFTQPLLQAWLRGEALTTCTTFAHRQAEFPASLENSRPG